MSLLVGTDLTRRFGPFTAVDGVSIAVGPREVVGLLGANGAGKTTLLRMLLGLDRPTAGTVRFLGAAPSRATRHDVGYVSQHLGLYTDLTVAANRRFQRDVFGASTPVEADAERITGAGVVDIAEDALVGDLPLGTQRRLAFEVAVAHDPQLLVLDEPTSGVGPLGRARLWDAIGGAAAAGRGVLVTTHYLSEAEQCDRLVVMAGGRVVAEGTVADVVAGTRTTLVTGAAPGRVLAALADAGLVAALAPGGVGVPGTAPDEVRRALDRAGVDASIGQRAATLEERFAELAVTKSATGRPRVRVDAGNRGGDGGARGRRRRGSRRRWSS